MRTAFEEAAQALQHGDPLAALKRVALSNDATALALRGCALAQLGEHARAIALLRRAARAFGEDQPLERARCTAALCELSWASRAARWPARELAQAIAVFDAHGDRQNTLYARLLLARRALSLGQVDGAERALAELDVRGAAPLLRALFGLAAFELALRRGKCHRARSALLNARDAAAAARIPALAAEVEQALRRFALPAAHLLQAGTSRAVTLEEAEALLRSPALVVDVCRRCASRGQRRLSLLRRPVLFALLASLAETHPRPTTREQLLAAAFGMRRATASLRARLRVEIGRLRRELRGLAQIHARPGGFVLVPASQAEVALLSPPNASVETAVSALLADGVAWSTAALALALGTSQRSVQRSLRELQAQGRAESCGTGRNQRWVAPASGFTTAMLLLPNLRLV